MRNAMVSTVLILIALHSPMARAAEEEIPPPIRLVSSFLELAPDQTEALLAALSARESAVRPVAMQLHQLQQQLAATLEEPAPDPATVGELILRIRDGQRQVQQIAREATAPFEDSLTADQKQRLEHVRAAAQLVPVIEAFRATGLL